MQAQAQDGGRMEWLICDRIMIIPDEPDHDGQLLSRVDNKSKKRLRLEPVQISSLSTSLKNKIVWMS
jgi:hypothetical protein